MFFRSLWYRRPVKKFKYSPNRSRTYEVLVASPDSLPLSYRRLVGAKDTKLGSRDKHPENWSKDYRTSITHYIGSNTKWMILCSLIEALWCSTALLPVWSWALTRLESLSLTLGANCTLFTSDPLSQFRNVLQVITPSSYNKANLEFWAHFGPKRSQVSLQLLEWKIMPGQRFSS